MMGSAMRRRMGAPSSTVEMAGPLSRSDYGADAPDGAIAGPANPLDTLMGHFKDNQGWLDSNGLQRAMKSVDSAWGPGAGKQAHKELVSRGALSKQRARNTHYSLNG